MLGGAHTQVLWRDPTPGVATLLYRVVVDRGISCKESQGRLSDKLMDAA